MMYMKKTKVMLVIGILGIMILAGTNTATACELCGRWTGGGSIIDPIYGRVTHGFELHCNTDRLPNNLEVNWAGNHFHLGVLEYADCGDETYLNPEHPLAYCDWIYGEGVGKLNGVSNCHIKFYFTDDGEPGGHDYAHIRIFDQNGIKVLDIEGNLKMGNQQAHRCTGIDARI